MAVLPMNTEGVSLVGCSVSIGNGTDSIVLNVISGSMTYMLPNNEKLNQMDRGQKKIFVRGAQQECTASIAIDLAEITASSGNATVYEVVGDFSAKCKKSVAGVGTYDITITFPIRHGFAVAETLTLLDCTLTNPLNVTVDASTIQNTSIEVKYFNTSGTAATA